MLLTFISLFTYILYVILKYRKALYMLQQNSYNISNRYLKWTFINFRKTFFTIELLIFPILIITYNYLDYNFFVMLILILYGIYFCFELKNIKKEQHKKPFAITKRIKRLTITLIILISTIFIYIILTYNKENLLTYYILLALFSYFSFIITYIANIINYPIEKIVYYYYKNKAISKLNTMSDLIKIGITGSYGKTSSKNILNAILNTKYNSFTTSKSLNTPYGLMTAINNNLDKFDDIFIAEMGACKRGDIKELCDFIKPKYGIITSIGFSHLETFKTIENITNTKFELVESLSKDGIAILNKDDINQTKYNIKNSCKIIWIGIDKDADVIADNIKITNNEMNFDVTFKKENKKISFNTKLLGKFNIYNILGSLALARELNIDIEDLKKAVQKLKPTEHRLEIKKINDITIIDDAFNSNPQGAKMALEVLNLMPGQKIIVTPGMVELGNCQEELNKIFGKQISKIADIVILIGEKQTKPIYQGLTEENFQKEKIYVLNDVKESFKLINKIKTKNTYVLLENDLPDIFTEQ